MGENGTAFFFDSYAQIELIKGNPSYAPYRKARMRFIQMNTFEVYEWLLREGTVHDRKAFMKSALNCQVPVTHQDIRLGARMHLEFRKMRMSMTDCVGYVASQRLGIKFLTGDKAFKCLPNVEFVQ